MKSLSKNNPLIKALGLKTNLLLAITRLRNKVIFKKNQTIQKQMQIGKSLQLKLEEAVAEEEDQILNQPKMKTNCHQLEAEEVSNNMEEDEQKVDLKIVEEVEEEAMDSNFEEGEEETEKALKIVGGDVETVKILKHEGEEEDGEDEDSQGEMNMRKETGMEIEETNLNSRREATFCLKRLTRGPKTKETYVKFLAMSR